MVYLPSNSLFIPSSFSSSFSYLSSSSSSSSSFFSSHSFEPLHQSSHILIPYISLFLVLYYTQTSPGNNVVLQSQIVYFKEYAFQRTHFLSHIFKSFHWLKTHEKEIWAKNLPMHYLHTSTCVYTWHKKGVGIPTASSYLPTVVWPFILFMPM